MPAGRYWDLQLVQNYVYPLATFGEEPMASWLKAKPDELIRIFPEQDINVVVVGGETNGYWRIMGANIARRSRSTSGGDDCGSGSQLRRGTRRPSPAKERAAESAAGNSNCPGRKSNSLVQALVVERAGHRRERVAEFLILRRDDVIVVGLLVLPDLDHGEMVRPAGLLEHLEAHHAGFLAAVGGQRLERGDALVLARRRHVDMGHHEDRAGRDLGAAAAISKPECTRSSIRLMSCGFIFSRKSLVCAAADMGVVGLLVLPDRHHHELVRRRDALQDLVALVAVVLAAGGGELLQRFRDRGA